MLLSTFLPLVGLLVSLFSLFCFVPFCFVWVAEELAYVKCDGY